MRFAPEGRPFILGAWALLMALLLLGFTPAAWLWLAVTIWVMAFFRDPERDGPRDPGLLIAPADGKVVSVREIDEPDFLGQKVQRISIFMNVFNVHVNRYPASGTVKYRSYRAGKFLNAAGEKASLDNEQSSVGLETARGNILIRQIAGLVARRIVTDHQEGATVQQGERLGLIRFGSRVDLFLPLGAEVMVQTGELTRAGQTVVARWP